MFDLHFDYPVQLGGTQLNLIVDFFNLFNQQNGTDFWYSRELGGTVNPDPSLGIAPCPTCVDPDFGLVEAYQTPRQIRFAVRLNLGGGA